MSRTFLSPSTQYAINTASPISSTPLSMACWIRTGSLNNIQNPICVGQWAADNKHRIVIRGDVGGDPVQCTTVAAGAGAAASTSTGISANTWHSLLAVFTSATSRAIYIDGGSKGTNATNKNPAGFDRTVIGAVTTGSSSVTQYMDGQICEVAIWNAALTDAEALILTKYSPLFVRPESLVYYVPLIGRAAPEIDIVGGYDMALINAPLNSATQPPIIYPSSTQYGLTIPSAPAASPYMTTSPGLWGPL